MIQIIYILLSSAFVLACSSEQQECVNQLYSFQFEVFGKVQGVYFRKFTQLKAQELDLVGWVQNTKKGTVIGIAQGRRTNELKEWLQNTGSPKSIIKKTEFKNDKIIDELEYDQFDIIK
ncbi:unnamed protein product [Paramecium octaurelia]|uniref:Acylphosphatase n=1 Tax=Paramecium octaurelia TaxID=43137 RepID=A0A8S1U4M0_PAROT|nr:unnamed protein product [Paramecium octaurelia]